MKNGKFTVFLYGFLIDFSSIESPILTKIWFNNLGIQHKKTLLYSVMVFILCSTGNRL